jgi:hypothetical protein
MMLVSFFCLAPFYVCKFNNDYITYEMSDQLEITNDTFYNKLIVTIYDYVDKLISNRINVLIPVETFVSNMQNFDDVSS